MVEPVTILADWVKTHPNPHTRMEIIGDHMVLTFGKRSPELPFPAWMWLVPMFWPILFFLADRH